MCSFSFTLGSTKPTAHLVALIVYKVANSWEWIFHFHWRTKECPTIQLVDKGSISFWLSFNDFALDAPSRKEVLSQSIILYGFASFHNKVVNRYFSSGFQIKAEGTDFSLKNSVPLMYS